MYLLLLAEILDKKKAAAPEGFQQPPNPDGVDQLYSPYAPGVLAIMPPPAQGNFYPNQPPLGVFPQVGSVGLPPPYPGMPPPGFPPVGSVGVPPPYGTIPPGPQQGYGGGAGQFF